MSLDPTNSFFLICLCVCLCERAPGQSSSSRSMVQEDNSLSFLSYELCPPTPALPVPAGGGDPYIPQPALSFPLFDEDVYSTHKKKGERGGEEQSEMPGLQSKKKPKMGQKVQQNVIISKISKILVIDLNPRVAYFNYFI